MVHQIVKRCHRLITYLFKCGKKKKQNQGKWKCEGIQEYFNWLKCDPESYSTRLAKFLDDRYSKDKDEEIFCKNLSDHLHLRWAMTHFIVMIIESLAFLLVFYESGKPRWCWFILPIILLFVPIFMGRGLYKLERNIWDKQNKSNN